MAQVITVQLYAFFRPDEPEARWADPEAFRTEREQPAAARGGAPGLESEQGDASSTPQGFTLPDLKELTKDLKLPEFKNPFGGDE